jgi:hypothetical protein
MNYNRIYNELITRSEHRIITGYVERHHIVPKCMGGTDDPTNIAVLTAEEHFVAHQLLVKIYPDSNELTYAASLMCSFNESQTGRSKNKLYAWIRIRVARAASGRFKGKPKSTDHRSKISKSQTGRKQSLSHVENRRASLLRNSDRRIAALRETNLRKAREKENAIITALIYTVT